MVLTCCFADLCETPELRGGLAGGLPEERVEGRFAVEAGLFEDALHGNVGKRGIRQPCLGFEHALVIDELVERHTEMLIDQGRQAARMSFAHAVRLSTTVDIRSLALAQAAHELGEFAQAVEQYDVCLAAVAEGPSTAS